VVREHVQTFVSYPGTSRWFPDAVRVPMISMILVETRPEVASTAPGKDRACTAPGKSTGWCQARGALRPANTQTPLLAGLPAFFIILKAGLLPGMGLHLTPGQALICCAAHDITAAAAAAHGSNTSCP